MKRLTFPVPFHKNTTHWVNVHLHTSRRVMRGVLTKLGNKDSSRTLAACWQANKPAVDSCIAELHFCRELTLNDIAHECAHAAFHRARLTGWKFTDKGFEEMLSEGTGDLTDAILAKFDSEGVRVRYQCAPRRAATKRYVKR